MRLPEHRLNVNGFRTSPDHLISIRYTNVIGVARVNRSITFPAAGHVAQHRQDLPSSLS
jgi:hypothetical protein